MATLGEGVRSLDEADGAGRWAGARSPGVRSHPDLHAWNWMVMETQDRSTAWESPCWGWIEASEDEGEGKAGTEQKGGTGWRDSDTQDMR